MALRSVKIAIAACALAAATMFSSVARAGDVDDWLALERAASEGDLKTVKELLARGAKPDTPHPGHEDTYSPLDVAVGHDHVAIAKVLLEHHANINDADNVMGFTPLMVASAFGHADCVLLLLKRGAEINLTDKKEHTALNWALHSNDAVHVKIADLLRKHGAVAGVAFVDNSTPAAPSPPSSAVAAGDQDSALYAAARKNDGEAVSLLLDKGANPNFATPTGGNMPTPLSMAAYFCNAPMIDALLTHGASRSATNSHGDTAAHLAEIGWTNDMKPCSAEIVAKLSPGQ